MEDYQKNQHEEVWTEEDWPQERKSVQTMIWSLRENLNVNFFLLAVSSMKLIATSCCFFIGLETKF